MKLANFCGKHLGPLCPRYCTAYSGMCMEDEVGDLVISLFACMCMCMCVCVCMYVCVNVYRLMTI